MRYETRNLRELPKFRDGLSYLYVEHAVVEQEDKAIALYREDGVVAVPAASLGVLMLGPGTRITHAAVKALADNGCSALWVGEEMSRFYSQGMGETRSSARLLRQALAWANPESRFEVVIRLYRFRFPEPLPDGLTLQQIRGREGVRVRDAYAAASRESGVPWTGRQFHRNDWGSTDPVNRALSAGASFLYGISHAAIVSAGYSPTLGFIHTGKMLSFVYDVADLYRADILIPAAFRTVAESETQVESRVRKSLRERFREVRLLERVVDDLHRLFDGLGGDGPEDDELYASDGARPGELWDPEGNVEGGVDYGSDGAGEGSEEPSR